MEIEELLNISKDLEPERFCCIYLIHCSGNNKIYIGSTNNYQSRMSRHKAALNKGDHSTPYLQYSWSKYGSESFNFRVLEIIDNVDRNYIVERENFYLLNMDKEYLFNTTIPALKMNEGWVKTDRRIEVLRQRSIGNKYGLGRKMSEKCKEALREANSKRDFSYLYSEENRLKAKKSMEGKSKKDPTKTIITKELGIQIKAEYDEIRRHSDAKILRGVYHYLQEKYNTTRGIIQCICTGTHYSLNDKQIPRVKERVAPERITLDSAIKIKRDYGELIKDLKIGKAVEETAKINNVSISTVYNIISNRHPIWKSSTNILE